MRNQPLTASPALPQLAPGGSLGIALGIPTVPNLRDVGGYTNRDGATVARGLAYRSDNFNPMSAEDLKKLERLGLKNDCDLRTTAEVKVKPDQMPPGVRYHSLNVLADAKSTVPAELEALMHEPKKANVALGGGKIETLFIENYREFVSLPSARQSYRTLFQELADRQKLPAVFHCTTGKDRTGWAAAALLTLLGVPKETVMEDFMRSNENTLPHFQRAIDSFIAAGGDRDIPVAIFGVKGAAPGSVLRRNAETLRDDREILLEGAGNRCLGTKGLARSFPREDVKRAGRSTWREQYDKTKKGK